jgi:hypothetical protein
MSSMSGVTVCCPLFFLSLRGGERYSHHTMKQDSIWEEPRSFRDVMTIETSEKVMDFR